MKLVFSHSDVSVLISLVAGFAFFPVLFLHHTLSYHFLFSQLPTRTLAGHALALSKLTHLTPNTQQTN